MKEWFTVQSMATAQGTNRKTTKNKNALLLAQVLESRMDSVSASLKLRVAKTLLISH